MEKTTHEIVLPDSGAKVVFYDFLTIGDIRKIRKSVAESMRIKIDETGLTNVEPISGAIGMDQEELVLECVIKEIVQNDAVIADIKKFIYDLSMADGDLVYQEANRISSASEMSKDVKKK